jgi:Zn-dependent protease with chaperone function
VTLSEARYFDGKTASDRRVRLWLDGDYLDVEENGSFLFRWNLQSIRTIERPRPGFDLRLTLAAEPTQRLVITDQVFAAELLRAAPHLQRRLARGTLRQGAVWLAGSIALLTAVVYLTVQFLPYQVARILPASWWGNMGKQMEATLVGDARPCLTTAGSAAIRDLVARLATNNPQLPPVAIGVYRMGIMNAWALPGHRVIVTSELIRQAEAPEELAGVLAHELGHVAHLDAESEIIRESGLDLLIRAATGGAGTGVTSMAGLVAVLSYSRAAETAADAYARQTLIAASVDPMGLYHFFDRVLRQEGRSDSGTLGEISNIFATHPGTKERMNLIKPLPDGNSARPVLPEKEWRDLKSICQ